MLTKELGRGARKLGEAIDLAVAEMAENEQLLMGVQASTLRGEPCLLGATSRRIIMATAKEAESVAYSKVLDITFAADFRKARLTIRAQGAVLDVKDMHLDRGREFEKTIRTARRSSAPELPGGGL